MRKAYHMTDLSLAERLVAKRTKVAPPHPQSKHQNRADYFEDVRMQSFCIECATAYNKDPAVPKQVPPYLCSPPCLDLGVLFSPLPCD